MIVIPIGLCFTYYHHTSFTSGTNSLVSLLLVLVLQFVSGTPSPPIKSLDFRGFDSSRLLILRGGNSHVRGILQGVSRKKFDSRALNRWTGRIKLLLSVKHRLLKTQIQGTR